MFEAWGRTGRREGGNTHSLAHRCVDVAAVFARTTGLPVIRDRLETAAGAPLTESVLWRLAALVFPPPCETEIRGQRTTAAPDR